jgi:hypothetical protein
VTEFRQTARNLAGHAHGHVRGWFAKIWTVRGGGLYACGYALTFAYMEVKMFVTDVLQSDSFVNFIASEVMHIVLHFAIDSIINMVYAFMWPVYVIQFHPPYGMIALAAAFVLFPMYLRKPVMRWLFPDGIGPDEEKKGP